MFSGVGGAEFALKRAKIPYECVGYSEIDKFAIQCYNQNHQGIRNFGDCTKINPQEIEDFDLLTAGFPCQAFSVAGRGLGELDTRGTLFNEIIKIAEIKKPRFMLLENVKGLTTKKHKATFNKIVSELERIGYKLHIKVLNSKDYGIPQNRERVWFVCFRDIEDFNKFKWPERFELKIFVKDILEENPNLKYNLSEKAIRGKVASNYRDRKLFDVNDICPTLKIGGDIKNFISPTLTTELAHSYGNLFNPEKLHELIGKWRRLTPLECSRLMGFNIGEINFNGLSDSAIYRLMGNGWTMEPATSILKEMIH
jgi:DNA (cytosine-5)-methyltransferase 1